MSPEVAHDNFTIVMWLMFLSFFTIMGIALLVYYDGKSNKK